MTSRERTAQRKQDQADLKAQEAQKAKAARAAKPKSQPKKATPKPRRVKRVPIHRPGEDAIYTDDELLELPPAVLNSDQQARRKRLMRNRNAQARRNANRRTRTEPPKTGQPRGERDYCVEIKENGDRCGSFMAYGTEHCRFHMTPEELEAAGLPPARSVHPTPLLGIKTVLTPQQQYRRVLEKAFAVMINKKLNVFGLELVGFDPHGEPILEEIPGGGVKIYGESKDGDIVMTGYDDLGAMNKVFEEMQDRVFGKARQALTVEGGTKPIEVQPVRTVARAKEFGTLLDQYGILPNRSQPAPHNGRQRRAPSKPTEDRHNDAVKESKNGKS